MSTRKRNEFLDGDDSEEELDKGYESEPEEGRGAIANKRRKVDIDASSDASFHSFENDEEGNVESSAAEAASKDDRFDLSKFGGPEADEEEVDDEGDDDDDDDEAEAERSDHDRRKPAKTKKSKDQKQYEAAQKKVQKSGVIYISRVPPFMKPQTLRHFLEPHARKGLNRVFLTPEDQTAHQSRVKRGGNKKKSFVDGWVEFNSKKEAKIAAEALNGNIIGGKKGNFYHDDIWNIKYLHRFKWNDLTEQIANENAERAARMKEEIRRTRKENKAFVEDVERSKMLEGMENKRKAKREREGSAASAGDDAKRRKLEFKQRKAKTAAERANGAQPAAEIQRMKSKIF